MSYVITGPVNIGTAGSLTDIIGDTRLSTVGTDRGTIFFAGVTGPGNLQALPPSTPGYILQTNGPNADPSWVLNAGLEYTSGFSVAKTAGDTFSNVEIPIEKWNETAPVTGLTTNPFYNTGTPNFDLATGIYTAPITGTYIVNAYIEYTNTAGAHGSLKTIKFVEVSSTPANGIILSYGPHQGSGNVAATESLHINATVRLSGGARYALRIQADTAATTNLILASSRFNITFHAV